MNGLFTKTCVRVSVTAIDSYMYFLSQENMTVEELLVRLRGEEPPNTQMRIGSALHKALENAQVGSVSYLDADGYRFLIQPNVELELPALREFKLEGEYQISDSLSIELVGKVDAFHGNTVWDHKSTGRFNADRLLEGYQWRFYLDLTGADVFQWNVFEVDQENWSQLDGLTAFNVFGFHTLRQYRYKGMEQDCRDKLKEFAGFLGLDKMRPSADYCTLQNLLRANR